MNIHYKNALAGLLLALALCACHQPAANSAQPGTASAETAVINNAAIEQAYANRKSGVQVSGTGVVTKLLADDNKDSRHQRFLVKINMQQTLLFAHNIDLAPRVPLEIGDEITFSGEYVYNPKGGIVHWTHHAPQGDHVDGWISHKSIKYQ